jgi:hypothetical protein
MKAPDLCAERGAAAAPAAGGARANAGALFYNLTAPTVALLTLLPRIVKKSPELNGVNLSESFSK